MKKVKLQGTSAASWAFQFTVIGIVAALAVYFVGAASARMRAQGIAYGFDIVFQPTGWQLSSPFLNQSADDPYWWTLLVAFVNTLGASLISIVLASFLGFWIGIGLLAKNRVIAAANTIYVEIFRNIPLVLQAMFWYLTLTTMPAPRERPFDLWQAVFVTNQGLFTPSVTVPRGQGYGTVLALVVSVAVFLIPLYPRFRRRFAVRKIIGLGAVLALASFWLCCSLLKLSFAFHRPVLSGFSFVGGLNIPLELVALVFATVIFSAAYIGEIVRGGLQSVPRGQTEAAQALGLSKHHVFMDVCFPIALRSMIPAVSNIFLFIVKATAIGTAIGYSELYSASVVSIGATGQSIEFLLIMMIVYFMLNYSITLLMNWWNRSLAFKGNQR